MVKKIRHTGIQTTDIKATKKLYEYLGFDAIIERKENWDLWGELNIIKLKSANGEVLEFIETQDGNVEKECIHLCFEVDNLKDVYDKLIKLECITSIISPTLSPDKTVKIAFVKENINNIKIELVEPL